MATERRLEGKVGVVTGAAIGIGEAIARKFAAHGATIVVTDIQREAGEAVAADIGAPCIFRPLDVCDPDAWSALMAEVVERFGGLDLLVNNAGGAAGGGLEHETLEMHRRTMDVNATGVWAGVRAAVPAMKGRHRASIINISSINGLIGVGGLASYVGAKFAITGMTRALAIELGDRDIRVNSVHPGIIATPTVKNTDPAVLARLRKAIERQPFKRMGQPEDIANAALFFASDESSFCTGSALLVDGGHIAGPYRDPA